MTTKIVGYFTSIFFILSLQKFCDKLISLSLHYYNKHETWRHIFLSRHKNLALVTSSWLRKLNVDLSHYKDNVQPAVSPPSPTLSPSWAELIFLLLFFSTFLLFFFKKKGKDYLSFHVTVILCDPVVNSVVPITSEGKLSTGSQSFPSHISLWLA